jgi:hypothetical protein
VIKTIGSENYMTTKTSKTKPKTKPSKKSKGKKAQKRPPKKKRAAAPQEIERIMELLKNGPRRLGQKAYDALADADQLKVMETAKAFLLAALDEYERNVVEPTRKRLESLGSSKKHR